MLLSKGYEVHGIIRRSSSFNTARIEHLYSNPVTHHTDSSFTLHYGDMTDSSCLIKLISQIQPTEVYHLAAQSHVKVYSTAKKSLSVHFCSRFYLLRFGTAIV